MARLLGPVVAEVAGRDLDQGGAALGDAGGVPTLHERADPLLLLGERFRCLRVCIAQFRW